MKYARFILGLMLVSLLFLTACKKEATQEKGAFMGGTQGVVTKFEPFGVEENGVFSIFDTETFPIEVTLQNKGEYQIQPNDVSVKLLGPAPDEVQGISARTLKNKAAIDKISEFVPNGGEETVSFATDAKYNNDVQGVIERDWFASVEYRYKTMLIIPEVCLKEDITDDRVCEVQEVKKYFVSGAPIIATSVEEDTAGRGIMALKIKIKDVGNGDVTRVGEGFEATTDKLAFSLDDNAWECKSSGRINEARLQNDEAEIICKLKEPLKKGDLFTKQLTLTLDYLYRDLVQETLRIKESADN